MYGNSADPSNQQPEDAVRVVGLMSGTSLDGIDAVLVEIGVPGSAPNGGPEGPGAASARPDVVEASVNDGPMVDRHVVDRRRVDGRVVDWRVVDFETVPYTAEQRVTIQDAITDGTPGSLARLHAALGDWLADAAWSVCRAAGVDPADVDVIGSHGQTVWHQPEGDGVAEERDVVAAERGGTVGEGAGVAGDEPGRTAALRRGFTLQLGDPATIAERTGIPVVADFRSRDVAAGGQGAPLVPWVDRLLFAGDVPRVLLNIGGMANVTRLPPRGSELPIVAFDTGPGNAVIDAAMTLATDGARHYDANGEWALRGRVDDEMAEALLADPYFLRAPPKSTGREQFGRAYVERLAADRAPADRAGWAGLVATLTEVVARSIADGITRWAAPGEGGEVVVSGGGAENPVLMDRLRRELEPVPVRHGAVLGVDPGAKEAVAFAVLAWAHVIGVPANVPGVTGAVGPRVLGSLTPGADGRIPRSTGERPGSTAGRGGGGEARKAGS